MQQRVTHSRSGATIGSFVNGLSSPKGWRLVWLNTKYSLGLWLLPVFIVLAWFAGRERYPDGVALWIESSAAIGYASILVGPLAGGAAAWVAYQTKRRRLRMLLSTLPDTQIPHHVISFTGLLVWVLLSYILHAVYQITIPLLNATWGHIDFAPILVGLVALCTATAFGYVAGIYFPYLATPPVVALLLFGWQFGLVGVYRSSSLKYLSPFSLLNPEEHGVLARFWPSILVPTTGWLLGLFGLVVAAFLLRYKRSAIPLVLLVASIVLSGLAASTLVQQPDDIDDLPREQLAYQPVCVQDVVEVCVHPAYTAVLPETVEIANAVFGPVAELPAIPSSKIKQFPQRARRGTDQLASYLPIYNPANGADTLARTYARAIIEGRKPSDSYPGFSEAQSTIGRWLVQQAEFELQAGGFFFMPRAGIDSRAEFRAVNSEIEAAVERFSKLSPAEQRHWFEEHIEALREGKLTLAHLP